jgi:hypothetical protein
MNTRKGEELAAKLASAIGYTEAISATCARICRHAATLHRLNEEDCNGPYWMDASDRAIGALYRAEGASERHQAAVKAHSKRLERWSADLEHRIHATLKHLDSAVRDLPDTDEGPWKLDAESDPRGCSVIIHPSPEVRGDSWGQNGWCIP